MIYLAKRFLTEHEKECLKDICAKMDIFELRNLAKEMGIAKPYNYVEDKLVDKILKKQMVILD